VKNFIVGLLLGVIFTLIIVYIISQPKGLGKGGVLTERVLTKKSRVISKDIFGKKITPEEKIEALGTVPGIGQQLSTSETTKKKIQNLIISLSEVYALRDFEKEKEVLEEWKELGLQAAPELLIMFRSGDSPGTRIMAARILGVINAKENDPEVSRILNNEVLPLLEDIINKEERMILRQGAVWALGNIKEEGSIELLKKIIDDELPYLTESATGSLARIGTDSANRYLVKLLEWSEDENIKHSVATALSEHSSWEITGELADVLNSSSSNPTTVYAIRTLAEINAREATPRITDLLQRECIPSLSKILNETKDSSLKRNAVYALGEIGGEEANLMLVDILESKDRRDYGLKYATVRVLGEKGGEEVVPPLTKIIKETKDDYIKIQAVTALGEINNRAYSSLAAETLNLESLPYLREIISSSKKRSLKRSAISALGRVGNSDDLPLLEEIARKEPNLRRSVNYAKNRIKMREGGAKWPVRRSFFW